MNSPVSERFLNVNERKCHALLLFLPSSGLSIVISCISFIFIVRILFPFLWCGHGFPCPARFPIAAAIGDIFPQCALPSANPLAGASTLQRLLWPVLSVPFPAPGHSFAAVDCGTFVPDVVFVSLPRILTTASLCSYHRKVISPSGRLFSFMCTSMIYLSSCTHSA